MWRYTVVSGIVIIFLAGIMVGLLGGDSTTLTFRIARLGLAFALVAITVLFVRAGYEIIFLRQEISIHEKRVENNCRSYSNISSLTKAIIDEVAALYDENWIGKPQMLKTLMLLLENIMSSPEFPSDAEDTDRIKRWREKIKIFLK